MKKITDIETWDEPTAALKIQTERDHAAAEPLSGERGRRTAHGPTRPGVSPPHHTTASFLGGGETARGRGDHAPSEGRMTVAPADPHGLQLAGEPVLYAAELGLGRRVRKWLRLARAKRLVRYIDLRPDLRPDRAKARRYLYAVADIEKHAQAIQAFLVARAARHAAESKATKRGATIALLTAAAAAARAPAPSLKRTISPEVIVMRRRPPMEERET
jgi:hypothetical protein